MEKEQRISEIKAEISRLNNELRAIRGYAQLDIKNADKLVYPMVIGDCMQRNERIVLRYLSPATLATSIRNILAVEHRKKNEKSKYLSTYPKHLKDLSKEEYEAVCRCTEECIEVIDKYNKKLHPYGIAVGEYTSGQSLYREE